MLTKVQNRGEQHGHIVFCMADDVIAVLAQQSANLFTFVVFMVHVQVFAFLAAIRRAVADSAQAVLRKRLGFVLFLRESIHPSQIGGSVLAFVLGSLASYGRLATVAIVAFFPTITVKARFWKYLLARRAESLAVWNGRHVWAGRDMWLKVLAQVQALTAKSAVHRQRMLGASCSVLFHFDVTERLAAVRAVAVDTVVWHRVKYTPRVQYRQSIFRQESESPV